MHLALFYCYGVFYSLSHRLAGMRYISTARPLQRYGITQVLKRCRNS
jgi:hypothetical protein